MTLRIHIEQDEDGKFVASCPTLPGCWSQGDTPKEAKRNIADAIEGIIVSCRKSGDALPIGVG